MNILPENFRTSTTIQSPVSMMCSLSASGRVLGIINIVRRIILFSLDDNLNSAHEVVLEKLFM